MITKRLADPASKLATARALSPDTATSSLGEILGLGEVDENELYSALDWLYGRQAAIEKALAKHHLQGGCLVLYDVSSSYVEGRCCELAQQGSKEGQAADRLRSALRRRRLSGGDRGVRGQYRRSVHLKQPGAKAEAALRPGPCRPGRRSGHDHPGEDRRGSGACRARLDHRHARPGDQTTGRRRAAAALLVRSTTSAIFWQSAEPKPSSPAPHRARHRSPSIASPIASAT